MARALQLGWSHSPSRGWEPVEGRRDRAEVPRQPAARWPAGSLHMGAGWETGTLVFYLSSGFQDSHMEQTAAELRNKKGPLYLIKRGREGRALLPGLTLILFWWRDFVPSPWLRFALDNFSKIGCYRTFHTVSLNTTELFNLRWLGVTTIY